MYVWFVIGHRVALQSGHLSHGEMYSLTLGACARLCIDLTARAQSSHISIERNLEMESIKIKARLKEPGDQILNRFDLGKARQESPQIMGVVSWRRISKKGKPFSFQFLFLYYYY